MTRFTLRQSARVVFVMGWADFVLKYRGSVLGYLWSLALPLSKFLVILHILRPFAGNIEYYPLYLFLGIILWEHFSLVTCACIALPQTQSGIIKRIRFPRLLLVLSMGWTHVIILLTYLFIFLVFALFMGAPLLPGVLLLPLILVQAMCISLGIGMLMSAYSLRYRDIEHLWTVGLQVMFWLTPVVYEYKPTAPLLQDIKTLFSGTMYNSFWSLFDVFIRFQPLSILIHDARRTLLYPHTLSIPSVMHWLGFTGACLALFLFGAWVFVRRSKHFLDEY